MNNITVDCRIFKSINELNQWLRDSNPLNVINIQYNNKREEYMLFFSH